ncbi:MAG: hypothetical protein LKF37_10170 [Lentilactobacillus diolivorans]|nr:hypothetical protein [Lentilactobacillus diolivorans]
MTSMIDLSPAKTWLAEQEKLRSVYLVNCINTIGKPEWKDYFDSCSRVLNLIDDSVHDCTIALQRAANNGTLTHEYMLRVLQFYTPHTWTIK